MGVVGTVQWVFGLIFGQENSLIYFVVWAVLCGLLLKVLLDDPNGHSLNEASRKPAESSAAGSKKSLEVPAFLGNPAVDPEELIFETKVKNVQSGFESDSKEVKSWLSDQKEYLNQHLLIGHAGEHADIDPSSPLSPASSASASTALSNSNSKHSLPNESKGLLAGSSSMSHNLTKICKSVGSMSSHKVVYPPIQKGKYFFYYKQDHYFSPQPTLFYTKDIKKDGKVVLDVTNLFQIGYVLRGSWVSNDGSKVAYGVSTSVDDLNMTVYLRDVVTCVDSSADIIRNCPVLQFSLSWVGDHAAFYYSFGDKLMLHKVQSSSADDIVVFNNEIMQSISSPNSAALTSDAVDTSLSSSAAAEEAPAAPEEAPSALSTKYKYFYPIVTHDGRYLIIEAHSSIQGCSAASLDDNNNVDVAYLNHSTAGLNDEIGGVPSSNGLVFIDLSRMHDNNYRNATIGYIQDAGHLFQYIANDGGRICFRTNYKSPSFRVVELDLNSLSRPARSASNSVSSSSVSSIYNNKSNSAAAQTKQTESAIISLTDFIERVKERDDGGVLLRGYFAFESILVLNYLVNASHELLLYDFELAHLTLGESFDATSTTVLLEPSQNPFMPIEKLFTDLAGSFSGTIKLTSNSDASSTAKPSLLDLLASLPLPLGVSVSFTHCSPRSKYIFYQYQGFAELGSVYRVSLFRSRGVAGSKSSLELTLDQLCKSNIPGFNAAAYETKIERIPVKITVSKQQLGGKEAGETTSSTNEAISKDIESALSLTIFGLKSQLSGSESSSPAPCIVMIHAGFGVSMLPSVNLALLSFVKDFGGIICLVHARGGGECGRLWHLAAASDRRVAAVEDLIAASELLVTRGLTSPKQLAVIGGSIGGLVASIAVNTRPDLFAAVVLEDSILDVCRHHIFDPPSNATGSDDIKSTVWIDELGSVTTSRTDCVRLLKSCPIRNAEKTFIKVVASSSAVSKSSSNEGSPVLRRDEIAARCQASTIGNESTNNSNSNSNNNNTGDGSNSNKLNLRTFERITYNSSVPSIFVSTSASACVSPIHSYKFAANWQALLKKYSINKLCLLRDEPSIKDLDPSEPIQQMISGETISKANAEVYKYGIYEARRMAETVAFIIASFNTNNV